MRLNACFQINFLKTIKILIEMRKTHQADEPFLLACCSATFLLFKNVCFSEISCASITANLLFVNTAKLLLESKVCNFRFCFRFVWRNRRWDLSLVTWPAVALCYMCRVKLAPRARQFHWAITKHLPISMQRQSKVFWHMRTCYSKQERKFHGRLLMRIIFYLRMASGKCRKRDQCRVDTTNLRTVIITKVKHVSTIDLVSTFPFISS